MATIVGIESVHTRPFLLKLSCATGEQKAKMNTSALRLEIANTVAEKLTTGWNIAKRPPVELLSTGLCGIEIPRGTLTEISGPPSSGRTSILNATLARSTRRPEFCALVDAGDIFDPLSAQRAGVLLPHLLWLRCGGDAEKALKATDLIVQAGGFGVIALDLASVPARQARRISLASWFRLRHAVEKTPTALIVIGEEHYTASCSTFQIESQPSGFEIRDGLFRGLSVEAMIGPRQRRKSAFALKAAYRQ
jgi:recombination protein RecA